MSGPFGSTAWMYSSGDAGFYNFPISNSLRFEDGDSALLARTPSSASNRDTWTWSAWVKRGNIGAAKGLFAAPEGTSGNTAYLDIIFTADDQLAVSSYATLYRKTTRLFRDPSAWYHIVVAVDTTDGTADNRIKLYVNGVQETSFVTNNAKTQDQDTGINSAVVHEIGDGGNHFDGYMAEVNFVDGSQLTPSSFGETKNDIWIPKNTSGLTFGTNGFRLQFKQTGTGTASTSTIGADTSGEGNHWTSNSLVASDVVPDSPTNNFATMNPLFRGTNNNRTISEGNLKYQPSTDDIFVGNFGIYSGKYYYEICVNDVEGTNNYISLTQETTTGFQDSVNYRSGSGEIIDDLSGASTQTSLSNASNGDIVSISADLDGGTVQFKLNNSNVGSAVTIPSGTYFAAIGNGNSSISGAKIFTFNFGQDSSFAAAKTAQNNADGNGIGDFYYAPPSGFLAMCTSNLPDPVETIDPNEGGSPQDYFNTVLYTGNAGTQNITGVGFQPDWVWFKPRSYADNNVVFDSVRGVNKTLYTNTTNAESDRTGNDSLTAFGSDGFSIGDWNNINTNSGTLVAWNWKAGTAFSNDASSTSVGTIDSTGSVSVDTGFSIISYTGTGSAGTIAHGLGAVPNMILVKDRTTAYNWVMYHSANTAAPETDYLRLNTTDVTADYDMWNDTAPTSSVFSVSSYDWVNKSSDTFIAYCFASVDGYSKFGSYTGNSNADGPFVYTGFRPAFVMIKNTNATSTGAAWFMYDNKRDPINVMTNELAANATTTEGGIDGGALMDFYSNGFKPRSNSYTNQASQIYMAFAEQPFKYANAR